MMDNDSPNAPNRTADQIGQIAGTFWQWHFGDFSPGDSWAPPINVYRLDWRVEVCVCLAGVDKKTIDVAVKPGLLTVRGTREAPETAHGEGESMRILSMEIDHGPFCREVRLPEQVDLARVESEYRDGLLWIHLPLRYEG